MVATTPQTAALENALQEAILHHRAGRLAEAEKLYRGVLHARPDHPGVSNNLGLVLKDQGRLQEAAATFTRVLSIKPDDALAHCNLGNVLRQQGRPDLAESSYRRALALQPNMAVAHKNLGMALCESGRVAESMTSFRRHAELMYRSGAASLRPGEAIPPHKVRHDQEQQDYLNAARPLADQAVAATRFHIEEGGRVAGNAINPDTSNGGIAARWQTSRPQMAVIDNLLTEEALASLRRFCWGSTIWHRVYRDGYLGAMPEHGFACPLLAQITEELRAAYPAILGEHPLLQFWGFKYDSKLSGIAIHADFAAVNINFWITPDEANLDAKSGGLVIWDVPAPLDWDFAKYNDNVDAARGFLQASGAHPITIPHRANRAVIFDSDLFHETDRIAFKDGYLDRRINITLLYGRREAAAKAESAKS